MRTRQEIKEYAKQAFAAQRGNSILALFLVSLVIGGSIILYTYLSIVSFLSVYTSSGPTSAAGVPIVFLMTLISIVSVLLMIVLMVNICGTFVKVYYCQPVSGTEPFSALKQNFGRKFGGMIWMSLWIYLWSLLFIIPGIIKAFAYSMTPYILATSPNVTATDALKLSMRMTDGHKGKIFVMGLSFIGWHILNSFTFGILGIFYVYPYETTAYAGLFVELRGYAVATGVIHPAELDGENPYSTYPQQFPQHQQYLHNQQYPQQFSQYQQFPPAQPYNPDPHHQPGYLQHPQYPNVQLHTPYQQETRSPIPSPPVPQDMYVQPQIPQPPPQPDAFVHIEMPQQPTLPEVPKPPEPPRVPWENG